MKKFHVVRAVNRQDGSCSAPAESFENEQDARAMFYTRASQACASDNPTDCVVLFSAEGFVIDHVGFIHEEHTEPAE